MELRGNGIAHWAKGIEEQGKFLGQQDATLVSLPVQEDHSSATDPGGLDTGGTMECWYVCVLLSAPGEPWQQPRLPTVITLLNQPVDPQTHAIQAGARHLPCKRMRPCTWPLPHSR